MTVHDNLFFDFLRAFTVMVACALIIYIGPLLMHWKTVPYDLSRKFRYFALFGYAILTAADQWHQIGKTVIIWRTPVILLVSITALFGMMLPDIATWRDRPDSLWDFDSPIDKYKKPDA